MKGKVLLAVLLLCLCGHSCIYDYTPQVQEGREMLVVNGDILIGEETYVRLTHATTIGEASLGNQLADAVYVESSDGVTYAGIPSKDNTYHIDTRKASISAEYRLVIEQGSKIYASDWAPVLEAPVIDSISYSIAKDGLTMTVDVSTHADTGASAGNRHYRWLAREVWEYHAATRLNEIFVPAGGDYKGVIVPYDIWYQVDFYDWGNYYCWSSGEVTDLMVGKTDDLSENRLVRHALYKLNYHSTRTQYLYSVQLVQEAITEEAWRYYEAVRRNSTDVGGLFSAQPSEMRGNIHNCDDAGEWVLGYVSVTRPSVMRRFIEMHRLMFHKLSEWDTPIEYLMTNKKLFLQHYQQGYRVTRVQPNPPYEDLWYWTPRRCYDCRSIGGNKNKPEWWPNDHQ